MARLRDLLKFRRTRDQDLCPTGWTKPSAQRRPSTETCARVDDRTQSLHWDLRRKPGWLNLPMRWRI